MTLTHLASPAFSPFLAHLYLPHGTHPIQRSCCFDINDCDCFPHSPCLFQAKPTLMTSFSRFSLKLQNHH